MYILLGALLLAVVLLKVRWFVTADSQQLAKIARYGFISVAGLALFFLLLSGRSSVFLIGILALLPFYPSVSQLWNKGCESRDEPMQPEKISSTTLSRNQALAILGLTEGATEQQIQAAHRRIIQKIHPDKGGSGYLAAQVNQAKEILTA